MSGLIAKRIAVIGLGLIGGSWVKGLREKSVVETVCWFR